MTTTSVFSPVAKARAFGRRMTCVIGTLFVVFSAAPVLSAQTVGISLVPSIERINWDNKLAFDDDDLYGGRLALRFGRNVELQPYYFTRDGYGMDSARVLSLFGPRAVGRNIDIRHYGTNVQFSLGDGGVTPFVRAGAGVLRLIPDSAPRQDRITISAGGGVRFGIGGLNAELFAEQMAFRMNPLGLFGVDTTSGMVPPTLKNLVYGAAITIPLNTAPDFDDMGGSLRGTSAPIEPFVGRLRYAGEFNLDDQEVAGVRAGLDFSSVFGLRGFYWRGVNEDRDGPAPVAGYGGEAQFNLNTGPGFSPYLVLGGGRIDYRPEFRDSSGNPRLDKNALILGGGASFRLSDRVRLNGAIRDYLMSVDDELDNAATTTDLTHSTMLTAGFTISFGGSSTSGAGSRGSDARVADTRSTESLELRQIRAERDRLATRLDAAERRAELRDTELSRTNREVVRRTDTMVMTGPQSVRMGTPGGQWITIPVPTQGEIILRYGLPASRDSMMRREVIIDTQVIRNNSSDDTADRLAAIERRLMERLDAVERRASASPEITVITPSGERQRVERTDRNVAVDRDTLPVFRRLRSTSRRDLRPYVGVGFGDSDAQLVLGLRADLGPINDRGGLHFVPELAVGLGGSSNLLAMANVQYAFGSLGGGNAVQPYFTFGGGIFTPSILGVNTAVGTSFALGDASAASPLYLNMELQGINLFDHTRLLFSVSRSRSR